VARLTADQDPSHRAGIADAQDGAPRSIRRRRIRQIGKWLRGVDDQLPHVARLGQQIGDRLHARALRDIIAEVSPKRQAP